MPLRNTLEKWGRVARALHWGMALVILAAVAIGLMMDDAPATFRFSAFTLHKSFGLLALGLLVCRILWRLSETRPLAPVSVSRWQMKVAEAVHWLLYALMLAVPVSGYLMSSYAQRPFPFFLQEGWPVPLLTGESEDRSHFFGEVHETLAWALIAVLALHIGGALYHHFIRKDDILARMTPFVRSPRTGRVL